MNAVEVKNLSKSYWRVPVLRDISFSVRQGDFFGLAGVNGAGKSTFLKCMLDFCHYEKGEIKIFDVPSNLPTARATLAFLPERFTPPYYLTGEQFLRMMMKLQNKPYDRDRAKQMVTNLDLDEAALFKPVRSYSKGMTQKLGLIGCFMADHSLYVLDEPMSGLDPKARALVKRQFSVLRQRSATLFFTSHSLADIEEICSTMAILHGGKVCFEGAPGDIRQSFPTARSLEEAYLQVIGSTVSPAV